VDGKLLQGPERFTYLALNKPKGYVTTVSDEKKRPTVMDLVQKVKGRVYPVGRLDWASEGLLLMTNDGALANALMKASSNVPKVYVVKVAGQPDESKLDKLRRGVSIAEKGGRRVRTAPAKIRLIREGDNPWLEVTIIEGRNRQVRKMFEEVGHHVEKIRRVQYGPLALDVPPGDWRNLTLLEVAKLKTVASGVRVAAPPSPQIPLHAPKAKPGKPPRRAKPAGVARAPKFFKAPRTSKSSPSDRLPFNPRSASSSSSSEPAHRKKTSYPPRSPKPSRLDRPSFAPPFAPPFAPSFAPRPPRPPHSERPPLATRSSRPSLSSKGARATKGAANRPSRPPRRRRD
jgi:23S rRNA pseudouridine2605 synthase